MQLKIITVPNPILRKKSTKIEKITPEIQELLLDLKETLKKASEPEGVGISAPQVGKNLQIIVTHLQGKTRFYLNPEILKKSEEKSVGGNKERPCMEGCLSVPNLYGPVLRPEKIKVKAMDEKGQEFTKTLSSFPARVFLHEFDHLKGILFTDHTLEQNQPLYLLEDGKFNKIPNPQSLINW